jgi:hypothetical protein
MNKIKNNIQKQKGQVLIITLIFLLLGSLIVTPLLNYMNTGLKTVSIYQTKNKLLYAADAGINKGIWELENGTILGSHESYDDYTYTFPGITVNGQQVVVKIDYTFILIDIATANFGPHIEWLGVQTSGNADINGIYTIDLTYDADIANSGNKKLEYMGVWLPFEFDYVPGSTSEFADNLTLLEPDVTKMHGGTSIKWSGLNYGFKNGETSITQKFKFTPIGKIPRGDVAWISTLSNDIGLSWDDLVRHYAITSTATDASWEMSTTIKSRVSIDIGESTETHMFSYEMNP